MIKIDRSIGSLTLKQIRRQSGGIKNINMNKLIEKSVNDSVQIKESVISPFETECRRLFEQFTQIDDVIKNEHDFGYFIRHKNNNELLDEQIKILEKCVGEFLEKVKDKGSDKPYHLINILYSTIIKLITPEHILNGKVTPQTFRNVIDNSIKIYNSYILKDGIDYRHILGRLINLRKMSLEINKHFTLLPKDYEPINWKSEEQLDYIGVLEIIKNHFQKAMENLSLRSSYMYAEQNEKFSQKTIETIYSSKVLKTLGMLYTEVTNLIKEPRQNYDGIKSRIEIAEEYFDRIPVGDKYFPEAFNYFNKFKKIEEILYKSLQRH